MMLLTQLSNPGELSAELQINADIGRRNWLASECANSYDQSFMEVFTEHWHGLYINDDRPGLIDLYTSVPIYKRDDNSGGSGGIKELATVS